MLFNYLFTFFFFSFALIFILAFALALVLITANKLQQSLFQSNRDLRFRQTRGCLFGLNQSWIAHSHPPKQTRLSGQTKKSLIQAD